MKNLLLTLLATIVLNLSFAQTVGDKVDVEWKGSWYAGKIVEVDEENGTYFITYDNWDSSWDEWVTLDRIRLRFKVGAKVQIKWQGAWYPGKILNYNADKKQYYISYDNYDSSWNEWVGTDRLK